MDKKEEQVDWDKVNRGKVRYGFALELYKKGSELTPLCMGRIEAFVDYVMDGVEDDPVEEEAAEGLKDEDLDKVLQALDSGKIDMDNLQVSLDKIHKIKQSYR